MPVVLVRTGFETPRVLGVETVPSLFAVYLAPI